MMKKTLSALMMLLALSGCEGLFEDLPECEPLPEDLFTDDQCTAIIELDPETQSPSRWAIRCGAVVEVGEEEARAVADQMMVGVGGPSMAEAGRMLNEEAPDAAYLFYNSPADFGDLEVVSSRTGEALLGVNLSWCAPAHPYYPGRWRSSSEITACEGGKLTKSRVSYDLSRPYGEGVKAEGWVLDAISQTPLPGLFEARGGIDSVVTVQVVEEMEVEGRVYVLLDHPVLNGQ